MPRLIQVRNVPDDVLEKLKSRAAAQGKSLNAYMLALLEREVERATTAEVIAQIRTEGPLGKPDQVSAAEYIRAAREERDAQLMAATSTVPIRVR
jgi:plasmid stability protein